jgi:hypothetical protein
MLADAAAGGFDVVAADHLPADLGCLFSTGEVS